MRPWRRHRPRDDSQARSKADEQQTRSARNSLPSSPDTQPSFTADPKRKLAKQELTASLSVAATIASERIRKKREQAPKHEFGVKLQTGRNRCKMRQPDGYSKVDHKKLEARLHVVSFVKDHIEQAEDHPRHFPPQEEADGNRSLAGEVRRRRRVPC